MFSNSTTHYLIIILFQDIRRRVQFENAYFAYFIEEIISSKKNFV